jgi:hypothetical protein
VSSSLPPKPAAKETTEAKKPAKSKRLIAPDVSPIVGSKPTSPAVLQAKNVPAPAKQSLDTSMSKRKLFNAKDTSFMSESLANTSTSSTLRGTSNKAPLKSMFGGGMFKIPKLLKTNPNKENEVPL